MIEVVSVLMREALKRRRWGGDEAGGVVSVLSAFGANQARYRSRDSRFGFPYADVVGPVQPVLHACATYSLVLFDASQKHR